jgi:hypothetical protein
MVAALTDEGPAARQNRPRGATGLTLLARLAEIHGGRAWVEERPGGGASFRVFLPAVREQPGESHQEPAGDAAAAGVSGVRDERAETVARAIVDAAGEEGDGLFDEAGISPDGRRAGSLEEVRGEVTI